MEVFKLPHTTTVNRVIPKNAFDSYANTKQKKLFTDLILRITWVRKISQDTVNLEGKEIKEIQIFRIELKKNEDVKPVLDIIDKAIPYPIIFIVEHGGNVYLSTSTKHPNPVNENNAIVDWTFKTDWFNPSEKQYDLQLKKSLDNVYKEFCIELSDRKDSSFRALDDLVDYQRKVDELKKKILRLQASIRSNKQFKEKVALNMELKEAERQLNLYLTGQ